MLQEENEQLKRALLGQKAERLPSNDAQLSLAILNLALGGEAASGEETSPPEEEEEEVRGHKRRKGNRNALPQEWEHVVIEIVPPEVQREGLDHFELVGTDVREVAERRPASNVVVELRYKKFVRKERVVRRYQDHQPLNRLEDIYRRDGLELAKSTMCTWHESLSELLWPLVRAMFEDAYQQPYLCTDATGVLVMAKEKCRNGHFWVLVAPEKHVLYGYSKKHDSDAVDKLLEGYKGYLVADAHAVYDHLFLDGDLVEVGCWAHCRRYFFKALESDPERAKAALSMIGALFKIERSVAGSVRKEKEAARRTKSRPVVDRFFEWCDAEFPRVLDETPIRAGLGYAINQRVALRRFLDDARLPLHNNVSELNLRRQVLGRKNWLFVGSDDGAEVNTVFVSLLASARMHGIEPLGYLRDLLCLIRGWPPERLLELAPCDWKQTFEQPETQQKLLANIFRQVVVSSPF